MSPQPFGRLKAIAAPLPQANVDTDQVIPARYLNRPIDADLSDVLFRDLRLDADGRPKPDFVLNQPPYDRARILVAGRNFGCGSSREHAVFALRDWGIRAVIAPSFGDIFHNNCFKNGLLPIRLDAALVALLGAQVREQQGAELEIDLEAQTVTAPDGRLHPFEIDPFRKELLLKGTDEIRLSLDMMPRIEAFEAAHAREMDWL